ncbi:MAG: NADH-quinone oxidoreductase subunit NuoK [Planctomycetota bacterium]|jgi:NADH-quinone oxidoreductase subunit K|nr:NADH-quinone oxidoreductase subunit NuoK [Planctomycetota bacterium]
MNVPSEHLLILAAILFAIGMGGFLLRRNVIVVLMSIELMLNAANIVFLAGARQHASESGHWLPDGPVMVTFVIAVAAVEAAVGLALVIALFRRKQTVSLDQLSPTSD